ncbi:hypothetical protein BC830DRAFT_1166603 [Chytriomyces sp. MP71]|nr:hypothetical protein BC830DRAFT_1166603 [Chytriomyces sp. MP71]
MIPRENAPTLSSDNGLNMLAQYLLSSVLLITSAFAQDKTMFTGNLKAQVYKRSPEWSMDRTLFAYTFDNGLTGTAGKQNLIDVVPGETGYSGLWQVNIVTIPASVKAGNITSKAALDALMLANPSVTIASASISNVQPVWVPVLANGTMIGNPVFPGVSADPGYTAFWAVTLVTIPSGYFRKAQDWASLNILPTSLSPLTIVNCHRWGRWYYHSLFLWDHECVSFWWCFFCCSYFRKGVFCRFRSILGSSTHTLSFFD